MKEAVSWAANGAGGAFQVDTGKIMTAGYSCGGTEALEFVNDSRVSSIGILNSGLLGNYDLAGTIRKPFIVMLGGPGDIAYQNVSSAFDETNGWEVARLTGTRENAIIAGFRLARRLGRETSTA
jgi:dienelactone hydrolase